MTRLRASDKPTLSDDPTVGFPTSVTQSAFGLSTITVIQVVNKRALERGTQKYVSRFGKAYLGQSIFNIYGDLQR